MCCLAQRELAGLDECLKILLSCFRKRMSAENAKVPFFPALSHIFSNSKSAVVSVGFACFARHLCFMLAINPRRSLSRAKNEGGLRRIRIMEKRFCYRMYYTTISPSDKIAPWGIGTALAVRYEQSRLNLYSICLIPIWRH